MVSGAQSFSPDMIQCSFCKLINGVRSFDSNKKPLVKPKKILSKAAVGIYSPNIKVKN